MNRGLLVETPRVPFSISPCQIRTYSNEIEKIMSNFESKFWNRSKQNYWIYRGTWRVIGCKTNKAICDFPAGLYDNKLMEAVCFAEDDEAVKRIINEYKSNGSPE